MKKKPAASEEAKDDFYSNVVIGSDLGITRDESDALAERLCAAIDKTLENHELLLRPAKRRNKNSPELAH